MAVVFAVGMASSWHVWTAPVRWTPDGVFYEAQLLELRGADVRVAREQLIGGPVGASASHRGGELADARAVEATAPFYRRRWTAPAIGAAIEPIFGLRSLLIVSLAGYLAAGVAIYALALLRAGRWTSAAAASAALLIYPMREWSFFPLTDSVAVALVAGTLVAAHRALTGGRRWMVAWVAMIAALSLTRDSAIVVVAAVGWLALRERSRTSLLLAASGFAAVLPALLLFGVPLRAQMAHVFGDPTPPFGGSWLSILSRYWPNLHSMLQVDLVDVGPYRSTLALIAALLLLFLHPQVRKVAWLRAVVLIALAVFGALVLITPNATDQEFPLGTATLCGLALLALPGGGPETTLLRAGAIAAVAYLLVLPNPTGFRLELTLIPFAAAGIAHAISRAHRRADISTRPDGLSVEGLHPWSYLGRMRSDSDRITERHV
jgi:hypothetical protein